MISVNLVLYILTAHFVGDYLCQTRQMGDNKHKSAYWLTVHVLTYTAALTLLLGPLLYDKPWSILFLTLNFMLHFITDAATSRATHYLWSKDQKYGTYAVMGLDQLIHSYCLLLTYQGLSQ